MITITDILKIGDKIELLRVDSLNDETRYPSQVLDIIDEDTLVISGPIYKSYLVNLRKSEVIRVICIVKDKGRYSFDAEILNVEHENVYKIEIRRISEIVKHQMRNYFRLDVTLPIIKYFTITEDENQRTLKENCRSKDLSGGGMRLYSNYEHNVGDIVSCEFKVDEHILELKAKVVRVEKIDTFEFNFGLGLEFIDIGERDRDKIIQYLFSVQRELREKGMI
ncbi:MAG: hypothetical protein GX080_02670 [Tissierellia bacterium]|nr:hypothetical protein [Tissierellia bacterium]